MGGVGGVVEEGIVAATGGRGMQDTDVTPNGQGDLGYRWVLRKKEKIKIEEREIIWVKI